MDALFFVCDCELVVRVEDDQMLKLPFRSGRYEVAIEIARGSKSTGRWTAEVLIDEGARRAVLHFGAYELHYVRDGSNALRFDEGGQDVRMANLFFRPGHVRSVREFVNHALQAEAQEQYWWRELRY